MDKPRFIQCHFLEIEFKVCDFDDRTKTLTFRYSDFDKARAAYKRYKTVPCVKVVRFFANADMIDTTEVNENDTI